MRVISKGSAREGTGQIKAARESLENFTARNPGGKARCHRRCEITLVSVGTCFRVVDAYTSPHPDGSSYLGVFVIGSI